MQKYLWSKVAVVVFMSLVLSVLFNVVPAVPLSTEGAFGASLTSGRASMIGLMTPVARAAVGQEPGGLQQETDSDIAQAKAMVQSLRDAYINVTTTFVEQGAKHAYSVEHEVVPFLMNFGPEFNGVVTKITDATAFLEPGRYRELPFEEQPSCPSVIDDAHLWDEDEPVRFETCVVETEQRYERLGDADGWVIFGADDKTYTARWERNGDAGLFEMNVTDTEGVAGVNSGTNHTIVATVLDIGPNDIPVEVTVEGTFTNTHLNVSMNGTAHYGEATEALFGMAESMWFDGSIRSDVMTINIETNSDAQRAAEGFSDTMTAVLKQSGTVEFQFPTFSMRNTLDGSIILYETNFDGIENLFSVPSEAEFFYVQDLLPYAPIIKSLSLQSAFADRDDEPTRIEGQFGVESGLDGFDIFVDTMSFVSEGIIPEIAFTLGAGVQSPESGSVGFQLVVDVGNLDHLSGKVVLHAQEETLNGAFVVPFSESPEVTLHLENQHGIETRLSIPGVGNRVGEITKGDTMLAEITVAFGLVFITYADGTVETLF